MGRSLTRPCAARANPPSAGLPMAPTDCITRSIALEWSRRVEQLSNSFYTVRSC